MRQPAPAFHVGAVAIDGRALLAPMAGVTDLGMRRAAWQFGASLTVGEMVSATAYARGDAEARGRVGGEGTGIAVVQIAGCRADDLAEAARRVAGEGAALVDINMGCPAKRVTGGEAGSALMRDLDHATRLIEAVVAASPVPVSLKMRLGWDHASLNAAALARRAEAAGVRMVTVHGRTRCQFYTGSADPVAVRAVKDAVAVPVVVNGDCRCPADAAAMLAASGADAVMVGRAALGRPWLVGQIAAFLRTGVTPPPPAPSARLEAALAHLDLLLSTLGVERGLRHARKHLAAYVAHARPEGADDLRHAIVTAAEPGTATAMLRRAFADGPDEAAWRRAA